MAIKSYKQNNKNTQTQPDYMKLGLVLPDDISDRLADEILSVLQQTPFSRISIPVSTYRFYTDESVADNDNRVITVGYVKSYDADTRTFTVVIFNANRPLISSFENPALEVVFSEYGGKLGVITKLNVIPLDEGEYPEEGEEAPAEG